MSDYTPNQEQVAAAVRWLVGVFGASAVQRGWIDNNQVVMLTGVAVALVPLVLSLLQKTLAARTKSVAAISGVTVVVTPDAPESIKKLADSPSQPDILKAV